MRIEWKTCASQSVLRERETSASGGVSWRITYRGLENELENRDDHAGKRNEQLSEEGERYLCPSVWSSKSFELIDLLFVQCSERNCSSFRVLPWFRFGGSCVNGGFVFDHLLDRFSVVHSLPLFESQSTFVQHQSGILGQTHDRFHDIFYSIGIDRSASSDATGLLPLGFLNAQ